MSNVVLYDALGPRGRMKVRVATIASVLVLAGLVFLAYRRLDARGQLDGDRYEPFTDSEVLEFLWVGLQNTLKAAVVSMVLASIVGLLMALARLSRMWLIRLVAGAYIEFFRAVPLLVVILFSALGLPKYGIDLSLFWYLVIGLTLYNSAVLAEIFRAGILSLPRGQTEAAYSVGLTYWQAMGTVVLPQAIRRMLPSLVSQLITLLKDTSLGFVIAYEELLRRTQILSSNPTYSRSLVQAFLFCALVYIAVNLVLSRVARRLEVRQRRRYGGEAAVMTGAPEDAVVLVTEGKAAD